MEICRSWENRKSETCTNSPRGKDSNPESWNILTKDGNGLEQRGQTGIPRATTPARVVVLQLLPYLPISFYCCHVIQCYTMPRNTRLFPAVPFPSYRPIMPYLCPVPHSTVACHNCLFPNPSHHLGPPCHTYVCFAKPFSPKMNTEWDWEVTLIAATCTCCPCVVPTKLFSDLKQPKWNHMHLLLWFQQS